MDRAMRDNEVNIAEFRDYLNEQVGLYHAAMNADMDDPEEVAAEYDPSPLELAFYTRFRVLLTYGGPTVYLEADVTWNGREWERASRITLTHSWAFPVQEIPVYDDSEIATYFDDQLQFMDQDAAFE